MIAEVAKLRADARKAEMETRVEPYRLLMTGFAAGVTLFGAALAVLSHLLFGRGTRRLIARAGFAPRPRM